MNKPYTKYFKNKWEYFISFQTIDIEDYLWISARDNDIAMVELCLLSGIDLVNQDYNVMHIAAQKGHLDMVKYLHNKGVDIRADRKLSLREAQKRGHTDVVEYIEAEIAKLENK